MSGNQSHHVTRNQEKRIKRKTEKVSFCSFIHSFLQLVIHHNVVMLTCKGLDEDLHGATFTIEFSILKESSLKSVAKGKSKE